MGNLCSIYSGEVLESYVTKIGDKAAALTFMRKPLKRDSKANDTAANGMRRYPAAMRELGMLIMARWAAD